MRCLNFRNNEVHNIFGDIACYEYQGGEPVKDEIAEDVSVCGAAIFRAEKGDRAL